MEKCSHSNSPAAYSTSSSSGAVEALAWTRAVMAKLGLTLNEAKTRGAGSSPATVASPKM